MSGTRIVRALDRMLEDKSTDLWLAMPEEEEEWESYYRALKTAMLLGDWTDEMPDAKICERYSVGPGDIYGMVESVNWLLHASPNSPGCLPRKCISNPRV